MLFPKNLTGPTTFTTRPYQLGDLPGDKMPITGDAAHGTKVLVGL